jgi:hypothetical protein
VSNIGNVTLPFRCDVTICEAASLCNDYDQNRTRDVLLLQCKSQAYVSTSVAGTGIRFIRPRCSERDGWRTATIGVDKHVCVALNMLPYDVNASNIVGLGFLSVRHVKV